MKEENKKIVIVGAGMAGLTAAAYLTQYQYDVLLLDKNERTGGLLGTFKRDGFSFDSGPRALVNSGIVQPILKNLGIQWDYLENKISIGIEDELFTIHSMQDMETYRQVLIRLYPQSQDDIDKIIPLMRQLSEYTRVLYEFDNPNFVDLMKDKKFIFKQLLPWMPKFLHALYKFRQYNQPMEDFLKGYTRNSSLIDIIIQHFFRKTPTYFALGYFYVYLDYFYPRGGTGALVHLLQEKVHQGGGVIKLNTRIVEINPAKREIMDAEGNTYAYDHLIWAADLKTLYQSIQSDTLQPELRTQIENEKQRVVSARGAESVFMLNLAVNRPPAYFQAHGGEHLFYTPARQGLGEINQHERERLIREFNHLPKDEILRWLEKYCERNTYEISIPVLRDSSMAPQGQTGVMISCLFDFDLFEKANQAGWYDEMKTFIENQIIRVLSQSIYTNLDQDILFKFSSTPLTIQKHAGSSEGAITGWSFEELPPVINKLQEIPKSVLTAIPHIYQAGQWAYSPAGVPIAMLTGWYATQDIQKQTRQK